VDAPGLIRDRELAFLRELNKRGVRYLVVGLSAAALQGAPTATVDVDLWIEDLNGVAFRAALLEVGGGYVAPTATTPPLLAGENVALFDLVVHMSGMRSFAEEFAGARRVEVAGVEVPVLPLERIIDSKRAARRPKDLAVLSALEATLRARES
jgi:predicted nucleotidyltransferase